MTAEPLLGARRRWPGSCATHSMPTKVPVGPECGWMGTDKGPVWYWRLAGGKEARRAQWLSGMCSLGEGHPEANS